MKDLIIVTIVGVLLWWVAIWPEKARADIIFDNNKAIITVKVFSF
jgi:hypothetical protein